MSKEKITAEDLRWAGYEDGFKEISPGLFKVGLVLPGRFFITGRKGVKELQKALEAECRKRQQSQ